jgi:hypothetical protein
VVVFDKRLVNDSGDGFSGCAVKDPDEDGNDRKPFHLEAFGVVDVAVGRGLTADVIVGSV